MNEAKELLKKASDLESQRHNFETEWQNVANVFRPIKANIISDKSKGDKSNFRELNESAPINFVMQLKSIIIGVFFNRSITPIQIKAASKSLNDNQEVKEWIDSYTKMMLDIMFTPESNFERSLSEAVLDDIVFGTFATLIEKGKKSPIKYHTLNIKNILIAENEEGDADCIIIKETMTARQIVSKWGNVADANIHHSINEALEKNPFKEFELQLHIYPREDRNKNKIDNINKPIKGVWLDKKNQSIIQELGWDSMPVAIGRSEKATGEVYGTSRAMIALADGRQINVMSGQINEATEKSLNPPMNVNATYTKRINLQPKALNRPDQKSLQVGRAAIEPITSGSNIPLTIDLIQRKEQNIREIFFLDKLKIFDDPRATMTQVLELKAETFRIMSDFIFGIVDYTEQSLNRTFNVVFNQIYLQNSQNGEFELIPNNGLFDKEIPAALIENPQLKINYLNPITQSQKLNESAAIEKLIGSMANLAQVKPEVLDLLDGDEAIRKFADILGVDSKLIKDVFQVKKERAQRQEQMQQQQALDQEQQAVGTLATAKKGGL